MRLAANRVGHGAGDLRLLRRIQLAGGVLRQLVGQDYWFRGHPHDLGVLRLMRQVGELPALVTEGARQLAGQTIVVRQVHPVRPSIALVVLDTLHQVLAAPQHVMQLVHAQRARVCPVTVIRGGPRGLILRPGSSLCHLQGKCGSYE